MAITYPAKLPSPLLAGYSIRPTENVIRTEMESGYARQRRRFRTSPTRIPVKWIMTEAQYAVFDSWYLNDADEGAVWFVMPLKTAIGVEPHTCRFVTQYVASAISCEWWEITAELEVRNRPVLPPDLWELVLNEIDIGLLERQMNDLARLNLLHNAINVKLTDNVRLS